MSAPILVFDIETVPDVATGRQLYASLAQLSDDDALTALIALREAEAGNSFMRQPLHKIACLSFLWVADDKFHLKSLSLNEHSEDEILRIFFRAFDKNPAPILVSWNGSGFDLPVIMYRALHHKLSAPKLFNNQNKYGYMSRYSDAHSDMMDKLALYNSYNRQKLDTVAAVCGIAGKGDLDGSQVVPMVQQGQWDKLCRYCESDVLNTWFIYLRYQLLVGKLSFEQHQILCQNTQQYLRTITDEQGTPWHIAFLDDTDASTMMY